MEEQQRQARAVGSSDGAERQTERAAAGEGPAASRREFLVGALAASGCALSGLSGPTAAQTSAAASSPQSLLKIGEIKRHNNTLRGVLTVLNQERTMPPDSGVPAGRTMLRYFQGKDQDGNLVWPPADAEGPLPGPTLRARVGDQVEITLLNHINTGEFGATGIDRAERGVDRGCDSLTAQPSGEELYPEGAGDEAPNCFHASSTINVHWHGTHVTPDGLGDNVLLQLRPNPEVTEDSVRPDFEDIFSAGPPSHWHDLPETWRERQEHLLKEYDQRAQLPKELQLWPAAEAMITKGLWPQYQIGAYPYCFELTEYAEDEEGAPSRYQMGQCPGTHWYHAHKHGSTAINVLNGMAGVFVIEGDYDDALAAFDPRLKQTEQVLIVQDYSDRPNLAKGGVGPGPPKLRVNGHENPTIIMQPGEVQLWRLVNASVRAVTTLLGFPAIEGAAPEIRQTAQDGVQFHFDNYRDQPLLGAPSGAPRSTRTFAPGNRIDMLVKAPSQPGSYPFRVADLAPVSILTLTVVEGDPLGMDFPTQREDYPAFPNFLKDIDEGKIRIRRTLDFGWEEGRSGPGLTTTGAPQFNIDGRQFSGKRYDQTMVLDDAEEWTLTNSTSQIAHPFHIHINPFQVVEIYDPTSSGNKLYRPEQNFVWQDVIAIPPSVLDGGGNVLDLGYVKIRHRFVDFPGSFVLHCHMLTHEDRGMMQLVRVIPAGGEATVVPHH